MSLSAVGDWFHRFRIPLILLVMPYFFMLVSALVDRCLRDWYKKHDKIREELRAEKLREAMEHSKKNKFVPTGYPLKNCSCQNIEPHFFFIWFSMISLAAAVIGFWIELENDNLPVIGRRIFIIMAVALCFHSVLMFVVLVGKIAGLRMGNHIECLANNPRNAIDEEGKRFVVFSVGLEGCRKILYSTVGLFFELIEKALDRISNIFDLKIFWIPSAFLRLAQEKDIIKNMRIDYRTVTYDLDFGDAYLRFCYEKLLNTLTFTIWSKFNEKHYRKWLDKHIRFVGEPPEIGNNNFEYHQARPSLGAYAKACPLFATLICAACGQYILFKDKVEKMRLGGVKMVLKSTFTMAAWTKLFLKTCCALRREAFHNELDDNIVFAGAVNTKRLQEFTECAFRAAVTEAPPSKTSDGDVEMQQSMTNPINPPTQKVTPQQAQASGTGEQEQMAAPVQTAYSAKATSAGESK
eukprot:gb/GECG01013339.1/.p1 GENE.gb/GECG01013339.1/~~gb/GECG01013339.1/.p1  ORF type:complete len:465 (+),score=41.62 gb/GECG01013339.1/:1-1395(+)